MNDGWLWNRTAGTEHRRRADARRFFFDPLSRYHESTMAEEAVGLIPVGSAGEASEDDRELPLFMLDRQPDEVFLANLLEHDVAGEPAFLEGHRIERLAGIDWPVLWPAVGEWAEGVVYSGLSRQDLQRIDSYFGVHEGLYRRIAARASKGGRDSGDAEEAFAYVPRQRTLRRHGVR